MASVKFQPEKLKKPNPRYVLELHTIRGMRQEVDKGLKVVIQTTQAHLIPPGGVPSAPQPAPQSPSAIGDALFSPPVHPTAAPPALAAISRGSSRPPPLQPAHRKKAISTTGYPSQQRHLVLPHRFLRHPSFLKESRSRGRQLVAMARKGPTASKHYQLHTLLRPLLRLPNRRMRKAVGSWR
jgi:hypothetical protein